MLGRKGKTDLLPILAILLVAAVAFGYIDIGKFIPEAAVGVPGAPSGEMACAADVTPDFNIKTYDIYNKGTAIAEAESVYRKVGDTMWTQFTTGTEITNLEPYTTYEFIIGSDTTDFTDNAFGPHGTFTTGCQEDDSIEFGIYNDEIETSLTATWYNADDTAATAETFSANSPQTVYVKWVSGAEEVFGNPFIKELPDNGKHRSAYPNLLVLKLNSTEWDEPDKVYIKSINPKAGTVGEEMHQVGCPAAISSATGYTMYCYEAPVVMDMDGVKFALTLNPDDTVAPATDGTAYIYSSNIYPNSDTGAVEWGNFNEDDAAVGADAADSLTMDFTA